jgi:hypothetical protein
MMRPSCAHRELSAYFAASGGKTQAKTVVLCRSELPVALYESSVGDVASGVLMPMPGP